MAAIGAWVSAGTRMLIRTISCPVLDSTAVCSIAHSSGALRLALVQRASQPAWGAFAGAASAWAVWLCAGWAGADCPAGGGLLPFGCWAWPRLIGPNARI